MTTTLSTTEKQAFEQLLEAWNAQQQLRLSGAPFDERITALEHVHSARVNMHLVRAAA
jgi:hypothetical protein